MTGIKKVLYEILGREACTRRGIDPDDLSVITGNWAWEIMAEHEISNLRAERAALSEMEQAS